MFWQQGGRKIFCQSTSRTCESNSSVRIGTPIGQDITRRIIFLLELSVDDDRIIFVSSLEKGLVVVRYQLHRELELLQLDLGTAVVPRPDLRPVHGHAHHVPHASASPAVLANKAAIHSRLFQDNVPRLRAKFDRFQIKTQN